MEPRIQYAKTKDGSGQPPVLVHGSWTDDRIRPRRHLAGPWAGANRSPSRPAAAGSM